MPSLFSTLFLHFLYFLGLVDITTATEYWKNKLYIWTNFIWDWSFYSFILFGSYILSRFLINFFWLPTLSARFPTLFAGFSILFIWFLTLSAGFSIFPWDKTCLLFNFLFLKGENNFLHPPLHLYLGRSSLPLLYWIP